MLRILTEIKTEESTFIKSYSDTILTEKNVRKRVKNTGEYFARLNGFFLEYLEKYNIPTGYLKTVDKNKLVFDNFTVFPFNCRISNVLEKKYTAVFSINVNELLALPYSEFYCLDEQKHLINESHLISFDLATIEDIKIINRICSKVNAVLKSFFERRNFVLGELICYFAKSNEKIVIIGDFSPLGIKILPVDGNFNDCKFLKRHNFNDLKLYTEFLLELIKT